MADGDDVTRLRKELEELREQKEQQERDWRASVTEDIRELKTSMQSLTSEVRGFTHDACAKVERIETTVMDHKKVLFGGDMPDKGLVVRTDRIEQIVGTQTRFLWLFAGALIVLGVTVAWQLFRHVIQTMP